MIDINVIRNYAKFVGMTIVRPVRTSLQAQNQHGIFGLLHIFLFVICLTLQYGWNMRDVIFYSLQDYPVLQRVITSIFVSSGQVLLYILAMMLLNVFVVWLVVRYIMGIREVSFLRCMAGIGGMITVPLVLMILSLFATWWISTLVSVLICFVALLFLPFAMMYFIIGHYEKSRVDVYWISLLVFVIVSVITLVGMFLLVRLFTADVHEVITELQGKADDWVNTIKAWLPAR
ncbi:hypothetical protein [Listeria booriae]|uniref:hypothetical protein n=1 Tax=Listeria booriae TaxID=1552123 RepID=UPI0016292C82|nr:hypothetical protein [Listeria booriae]MBC1505031.1 hypothetical protein [Listeria booriae]